MYTKGGENKPAFASAGWTMVLMDGTSHFIWELACGPRETDWFKGAMQTLSQVMEQTEDLTLFTHGGGRRAEYPYPTTSPHQIREPAQG